MGLVKAKVAVNLRPEDGGYHRAGDVFEYNGPDNEHLEAVDKGPYHDYSLQELKNELTRRGMGIPPAADQRQMSELLVGDDSTPGGKRLEPKQVVPAGKPKGNVELSAPYTDANSDALKVEAKRRKLTVVKDASDAELRDLLLKDDSKEPVQRVAIVSATVGRDESGFPVAKGSAGDTTGGQ